MPSDMPLFNYNINFEGLKNLLETVNISTNNNTSSIEELKEEVSRKLPEVNVLKRLIVVCQPLKSDG